MKLYNWKTVPEEKVSEKFSRRIISGEKEMVAMIHLKKGCTVPEHSHENEQITYIVEGAMEFKIEGRTFVMRGGDVLHVPSNVPHSAVALEDTADMDFFSPPREDWLTGKDAYLRR